MADSVVDLTSGVVLEAAVVSAIGQDDAGPCAIGPIVDQAAELAAQKKLVQKLAGQKAAATKKANAALAAQQASTAAAQAAFVEANANAAALAAKALKYKQAGIKAAQTKAAKKAAAGTSTDAEWAAFDKQVNPPPVASDLPAGVDYDKMTPGQKAAFTKKQKAIQAAQTAPPPSPLHTPAPPPIVAPAPPPPPVGPYVAQFPDFMAKGAQKQAYYASRAAGETHEGALLELKNKGLIGGADELTKVDDYFLAHPPKVDHPLYAAATPTPPPTPIYTPPPAYVPPPAYTPPVSTFPKLSPSEFAALSPGKKAAYTKKLKAAAGQTPGPGANPFDAADPAKFADRDKGAMLYRKSGGPQSFEKSELDAMDAALGPDDYNRVGAKISIMEQISTRMLNTRGLLINRTPRRFATMVPFDSLPLDERNEWVRRHISQWAGSSGDSDANSVALQMAVRDEFNLGPEVLIDHFGDTWRSAQTIYNQEAAALRVFVREMYANTQAEFKARGITHVTVVRGAVYDANIVSRENYKDREGSWGTVQLQPASSFSTRPETAQSFTGGGAGGATMHIVRTPVENVLGTARTGFGCLSEAEVVLLGGRYTSYNIGQGGYSGAQAVRNALLRGPNAPAAAPVNPLAAGIVVENMTIVKSPVTGSWLIKTPGGDIVGAFDTYDQALAAVKNKKP